MGIRGRLRRPWVDDIRMTFLARVARFLFWLLVVSWSVALLRRLLAWMLRDASAQSGTAPRAEAQTGSAGRLHRDPVCGTHIAEEIAVPLREAEATLYFCSTECRSQYARGQRFAANA